MLRIALSLVLATGLLFGQATPSTTPPASPSPSEQRIAWNQAHYTKTEVMVPMRDGKALYTVIYAPKDTSRTYPIILARTPYEASSKCAGTPNMPEKLGYQGKDPLPGDGFIFMQQDVRGRFHSSEAGAFVEMRPIRCDRDPKAIDESTDCWDTVAWALGHIPGHNGKVALMGISYLGFYAACGLVNPHPAVKVAVVQAPMVDVVRGDDFRRNGALHLIHAFTWLNTSMRQETRGKVPPLGVDLGSTDAYHWFLAQGSLSQAAVAAQMEGTTSWTDLRTHPHDDAFWQEKDLSRHLKLTGVPTMVVGGWFDAEDFAGTLRAFQSLNVDGNADVHLVLGPWNHGGWLDDAMDGQQVSDGNRNLGAVQFGVDLASRFRKESLLPFLRQHLKGGEPVALPKALLFETGTNRWVGLDAWPARQVVAQSFYFQDRGALLDRVPVLPGGQDAYVSDPARPVPHHTEPLFEYGEEYPVLNQWFASTRPDVLVYQTPPLEQELTLAGSVQADLWVATTGTDADWVVKVIDVWPDGSQPLYERPQGRMEAYQQLVRGDILRGKYRNSLEKPEPFVPGQPTRVTLQMPDALHTFKKGHRVMVQIQSSWFPLYDRNPQVYMENTMEAKAEDFRKATQTVFRCKDMPSRIILPLLNAESRR